MTPILKKIVSLSGEALNAEDQYLLDAIGNNQAYDVDRSGLLYINNERYYQFVVAKHLFKTLNRKVEIEKDLIDLVVLSNECTPKYYVAVEMKRWMSSTGNPEIPGIRNDFDKLKGSNSEHGLMLIFSSNPIESSLGENIRILSERIDRDVDPNGWFIESFETVGINGIKNVFWVAGYEVPKY
ncbi:hypothetical protein [Pseudoalteromonas sp. BDTF-M6]|uniref:hypothetical protein n=1 Tax=Pseudoalteromonas sp. BDTF-M6 TaxID=2796132 RepID=UPI001BAFDEBA|nr:hypothetical protein [Pseudoalteromonas sp. BDTF-M6]MBS3798591.1 hypothetical protein [Pseudoalteromonas sp. BDTF-M6]